MLSSSHQPGRHENLTRSLSALFRHEKLPCEARAYAKCHNRSRVQQYATEAKLPAATARSTKSKKLLGRISKRTKTEPGRLAGEQHTSLITYCGKFGHCSTLKSHESAAAEAIGLALNKLRQLSGTKLQMTGTPLSVTAFVIRQLTSAQSSRAITQSCRVSYA